MRAQDVLADGVLSTKDLLGRYLRHFEGSQHVAQAAGLPNHVAWNLGHLSLTMHRVASMVEGGNAPPPERDFGPPAPGAPATRFDPQSVSFGSSPTADEARYPSLPRASEIFDAACDRLAARVREASDDTLRRSEPWGQGTFPLHLIITRMVFHNGVHTGQIADIRRALKMPSVFS